MKFGQNLQQFSVPQWAVNNVDYDNIKTLIKIATTSKPVQAIAIPGNLPRDVTPHDPEEDVWLALCEEMDRVELFCRVKHGETQRRLEHHRKLIEKKGAKNLKLSAKRLKTLSRIEDGIIEAGNQIRMLSKYIGANRLAFTKLLKKFEKWGGSVQICERFRRQRLETSPWLNKRRDPLSNLLSEYTSLLEMVRAPFESFRYETSAEFDAVFSASSARQESRAIYWIHQDNVIQAHIVMQSVSNQKRLPAAETPSSPKNSPLRTFGSEWTGSGTIVSGQLDLYKSGHPNKGKTAVVHYTSSDKTVILTIPGHQLPIRRKDVSLLLQTRYALPENTSTAVFNQARHYVNECQDISPLVEIGYSRTRFAGVRNCSTQGIWAVLDNDIVMAEPGHDENIKPFPHAILDIRWEGNTVPSIVKNLDETGIAERIPNFDLVVHAVAAIYSDSREPEWMKTLQNDLRKPTNVVTNGRSLRVQTKNPSNTSTSDAPVSPFSTVHAHSSATSTHDFSDAADISPATRREIKKKTLRQNRFNQPDETVQPRYWNEFDDGDEDLYAAEPYAVEVYPDNEDIMVSMFKALRLKFRKSMGRDSSEQKSLNAPDTVRSSISSEETLLQSAHQQTYSTFATSERVRPETPPLERALLGRERVLFHATWMVYAFATSFLIMSTVLESIGRRKYSTESRVFSVFGILMSFLMASLGLICMSLTQRMSIVGKSIVLMGFIVICVADALLTFTIWQSPA